MTNCNQRQRFAPMSLAAALFLSTALLLSGCRKAPNSHMQSAADSPAQTGAVNIETTTPADASIPAGETPNETVQAATEPSEETGAVSAETTAPPDVSVPAGEAPGASVPSATQAPMDESPAQTDAVSIETTAPADETFPAVEMLVFPQLLENDQLLVELPFSYDGLNPDYGCAEGRGIAAITVKNQSDRHLVQAELTLILADGTGISFRIEHIPSGKKVTAFSLDNSQLPEGAQWSEIQSSAQFAQQDCLRFHGLSVQENGTDITLFNTTGSDMTDLTIYCHDLLGDGYFGGKAYLYKINNIPAGGTASVEALDSILGISEVTYAAGNQE